MNVHTNEKLDMEWVNLMMIARDLGLSVDEIKDFLKKGNQKS
ncbi:anti-repressor SinI family protein [Pseudalkalibacillus caeni]|uniref:DNA-binding anti-repressor SinI n=1 Tax=Exobacillus caeni TaxID=2574798 RepID=A0A5R9EX00_9BACL|nr:anti-repressor SinI family protein [Pseudalkalibacillus caeni]TLS35792.1 DNA-binding anti-repressor SinI [Pseudalkalibacillus caeni]